MGTVPPHLVALGDPAALLVDRVRHEALHGDDDRVHPGGGDNLALQALGHSHGAASGPGGGQPQGRGGRELRAGDAGGAAAKRHGAAEGEGAHSCAKPCSHFVVRNGTSGDRGRQWSRVWSAVGQVAGGRAEEVGDRRSRRGTGGAATGRHVDISPSHASTPDRVQGRVNPCNPGFRPEIRAGAPITLVRESRRSSEVHRRLEREIARYKSYRGKV